MKTTKKRFVFEYGSNGELNTVELNTVFSSAFGQSPKPNTVFSLAFWEITQESNRTEYAQH